MDVVLFVESGVWIHPEDQERFRFVGTPADLVSILVAHPEIDIEHARFLVHVA